MKKRSLSRNRKPERGISLLETVIAAAVMLIGIGGVMSLFTVVAASNMSQGTQATRCTEYAQDKMEQLMALNFGDVTSDTTQLPVQTSGGKGLTSGGGTDPTNPLQYYMDYITEGSGTGAAIYSTKQSTSKYVRQWCIAPLASDPTNVKTITVTVTALNKVVAGLTPSSTVVSLKTN